jgi:protein TonB
MNKPAICLVACIGLYAPRSMAQTGAPLPVDEPPGQGNAPLIYVEQMPEFPGGEDALNAYVAEHIVYPQLEKEKAVEGKVWLRFTVDSTGHLTNVTTIRGPALAMNKEAERVAREMPPWIPGRQGGKAVPVLMTLPLAFRLAGTQDKR